MVPPPRLTDRMIAAWHERAIVLKAMSFAAVGLVNSLIDFGIFSFLFYVEHVSPVGAQAAALGRARSRQWNDTRR